MDMTIDQQVALDEALVPPAGRLRIGRRNFHLQSNISSKESTLQLVHNGEIRRLTDVNINKLHQTWRSFTAIINKCLSGKSSGYDSQWLSQAQILWGFYHKRNVDFAYLLWEDFVYQVKHKDTKKSNEMYYPRFTKVIIHYFMSKDPSIPRRNKVNWHYVRDDQMFTTIKLTKSSSDTTVTHPPTTTAGTRLFTSAKGKQPAKASKAKSLTTLSEAEQLKLAMKRSLQQTHISQASGSGADEGTGNIQGVLGVHTDESDEEISWKSSDEEDYDDEGSDDQDDDDAQDDDDDQDDANKDDDDQEEGNDDDQDFDEEGEEFIHLRLTIHDEEETRDGERFDPIPKTPENTNDEGNSEENLGLNVGKEEGQDEKDDEDELYRDANVNLQGRGGMLNPTPDARIDSIFETTSQMDVQALTTVAPLPLFAPTLTPSTNAIITIVQQAPTPLTTPPSTLLQNLPNFGLLFGFDHRLKTLEDNFFKFVQTNQFVRAVSSILGIVKRYMDQWMNEAVKTMNKQLKAEVLTRSSNSSNTSYVVAADLLEMELKKILIGKMKGNKERKEPESVSAPKKKATRSAGKSTQGSKSRQTSTSEFAIAEEPMLTTHEMEEPSHPVFKTGADDQPIAESS
nr:hypothetical protein [Tanacetum cinerariifolium]